MQMDMRGRGTFGSLRRRWSAHPADTKDTQQRDALDGARETLVALGVVVLETDLELDGLNEVALLLAIGFDEEVLDGAPHACH